MEALNSRSNHDDAALLAAEEVFARYGYRRVSMADLADAAGLSRAGLYKRYSNKETLFRAAVSRLQEETLVRVEEAIAALDPDASTLDLVTAAFDARIGYLVERTWDSPHGVELLEDSNRLAGDLVAEASERFRERVASLLDDGDSRGEIRLAAADLDALAAANLIAAAVNGLKPIAPGPGEFRHHMHQVIRLLLAGMS